MIKSLDATNALLPHTAFATHTTEEPPLPLPARADHETNDNNGPLRRCVRLKFYLVLSEFTLQQLWACSTSWQCCTIYASSPGVYATVFLPVSCGLKMFDSMPCLNKVFLNRKKVDLSVKKCHNYPNKASFGEVSQ